MWALLSRHLRVWLLLAVGAPLLAWLLGKIGDAVERRLLTTVLGLPEGLQRRLAGRPVVLDGDTALFHLPPLVEGVNQIAIGGGAGAHEPQGPTVQAIGGVRVFGEPGTEHNHQTQHPDLLYPPVQTMSNLHY